MGVLVDTILRSQFNHQALYIMDNSLCAFNKQISPLDTLKTLPKDNLIMLFTAANKATYNDLLCAVYPYLGDDQIIKLFHNHIGIDGRITWIMDYAKFVYESEIEGNVAECGVFKGNMAMFINAYFPDKKLYLFDSFDGFRKEDIGFDITINPSSAFFYNLERYRGTSAEYVMSRMPFPSSVEIKQGYIPETFDGIEDRFCFVNLDMDVHPPMLEALKFFYPRMVNNGIILIHDYYSRDLIGVAKAVQDFENVIGRHTTKIPMRSVGSLAIIKGSEREA